jgi:hypothetical protein
MGLGEPKDSLIEDKKPMIMYGHDYLFLENKLFLDLDLSFLNMSVKLLDLVVFLELRGFLILGSFLFDLKGFFELDFEELLGRML